MAVKTIEDLSSILAGYCAKDIDMLRRTRSGDGLTDFLV